ncbi:inner nuclear membrane protein enriched at telomere/subtelomere region [Tilletia horrida]|uniref:Inner nuclear membrane protein enriched at telomere/subtelomere region n=1 Tax=Tilletia horrida TaxID=155126 RepID=A0AAN6JWP7_9BASI|nr:inner nuclear membrane protein enriched at telomere/subtelomere region [Tilletia horrida]KAK0557084.1 inner nuclear membrane protein enriched at telomere/subtelomere region [Tilletia horrida]
MVSTRRAARASEAALPSTPSRAQQSAPRQQRRKTETPARIVFADDVSEDEEPPLEDEAEDIGARVSGSRSLASTPRITAQSKRSTPVVTKTEQRLYEADEHDRAQSPRRRSLANKARQSAAASPSTVTSDSIAEARKYLKENAAKPNMLRKNRPSAAAVGVTPRSRSNASSTLSASANFLLASLVPIIGLAWLWHNYQTYSIGYCDSASASSAEAKHASSPASHSSSAIDPRSNSILRELDKYDIALSESETGTATAYALDANVPWHLTLTPPSLRPTCSPCPPHARCQNGLMQGCSSREYALTGSSFLPKLPILKYMLPHDGRLPFSTLISKPADQDGKEGSFLPAFVRVPLQLLVARPAGWLFGVAHGPRCVPDTHKLFLALQVGDEIRRVMRERRGQKECGLLSYPAEAVKLDEKTLEHRLMTASSSSAKGVSKGRRWGRGSKADPVLDLKNVPHWPEPFIVSPQNAGDSEDGQTTGSIFTTNFQSYDTEDFTRFNASHGPGGYVRWDLLQQHYRDIRLADAEEAIKAGLVERLDPNELSCSSAPAGHGGEDEDGMAEQSGSDCFDELWELAMTDLQRPNGVLRFPVTGIPAGSASASNLDGVGNNPYTTPLLLSTTSIRSLSCSVRLTALSLLMNLLPVFGIAGVLVFLFKRGSKNRKEGREEAVIVNALREEVISSLRERARQAEETRGTAGGSSAAAEGEDADASALLGDLSIGADDVGQAYLPIAQLRDILLPAAAGHQDKSRMSSGGAVGDGRESLSARRARRVWAQVRKQVGSNSNVRTNSRPWKGESMLVWEWVGV